MCTCVRVYVTRFVTDFQARHTRLDILVNNAGLNTIGLSTTRTVNGFELCFGVNFLAAFHLTNLLLPMLRASGPSRVVNVAYVLVLVAVR